MANERNYFITMHHQAEVHFENFTEVKLRDFMQTGAGHRDWRLNWDSPGQTGTYGRSRCEELLLYTAKKTGKECAEWLITVTTPHTVLRSTQRNSLTLTITSGLRDPKPLPLQNRKEWGRPYAHLKIGCTKKGSCSSVGKSSDTCLPRIHVVTAFD